MEVRDEALGVTPGRTASSADLGGSELPFSYFFGFYFVRVLVVDREPLGVISVLF